MNSTLLDGRPKILVVDDAPASLRAMRQVLQSLKVEVIAVGSGREALIQCMEHEFALVLLDVQMPGMDGYEVAELLRSAEHASTLPIVFLTAAYADPQHAVRGYDLGAVDYIYKPVDDRILVAKAAIFLELFDQRRQLLLQASELRKHNLRLKASMAKQRLTEQRNRTVIENMPVLVAALDDAGKVAAWNRACEQATGYCAKEIVGNPKALELLYPAPSRLKSLLQTWHGRNDALEAVAINFETLRKDGSSAILAWFSISWNPVIRLKLSLPDA